LPHSGATAVSLKAVETVSGSAGRILRKTAYTENTKTVHTNKRIVRPQIAKALE